MSCDFSGYVTKHDVRCSDGRIIRHGAFSECDGKRVPLVYQHIHDDVNNVLGHVDLECRDDGVYGYCSLNDTDSARNAAKLIKHGDIDSMSIYANQLRQNGSEVIHGIIREVSLVLSGANPEARIENLSFAHGDEIDEIEEEAIIYPGSSAAIEHSAENESEEEDDEASIEEMFKALPEDKLNMVYSMVGDILGKKPVSHSDENGTIFDTMTDEQQDAVCDMLVDMLEDAGVDVDEFLGESEDDEEDEEEEELDDVSIAQSAIDEEGVNMPHRNVFEGVDEHAENGQVLTHSAIEEIFKNAKRIGSLKDAFAEAGYADVMPANAPADGGSLQHSITDIDVLFPEVHNVTPTPAQIARPMEWVPRVLNAVKKSPFNRIKSTAANLTADEARARGYIKGKKKIEEQITLLKRVTTPQTVYKLQKLDRDDIIDITDLDVVAWLKSEMRMMLNEELARAVLVGDGRLTSDESKIKEDNIRPILSDADTYAVHYRTSTTVPKTAEELEAFIDAIIRAKKDYKGSGSPTLFIGNDLLTSMRLLRDRDGYRRYKTDQELADDLRVSSICEVQLFDDLKQREVNGKQLSFGAIIVNLSDYTMGATRGGQVTLFDDFDIDYNKYSYLIETRCCGALTQPASALVFEFGEAED